MLLPPPKKAPRVLVDLGEATWSEAQLLEMRRRRSNIFESWIETGEESGREWKVVFKVDIHITYNVHK